MNATPRARTTTRDETVARIAESFAEGEIVLLGDYMVARLVNGWITVLTFTRVSDGRTFTDRIDSDGPTHAAEEAYRFWTVDAWDF